jgi:glucokinase
MTQHIAIGVDIGGTKIAIAAADREGYLIGETTLPTQPRDGASVTIARTADAIRMLAAKRPIAGIGIACPGPVDPAAGVAVRAVNLGWQDVPLRALLQAHLNVPVEVQNDLNAGTLGELVFGAGRGVSNFIYLAVGTGLAGGAVINGKLLNAHKGAAMEVGHISLNPAGRQCNCGTRGCVEMYLSGKGVLAGAAEYLTAHPNSSLTGVTLSTGAIIAAAKAGDPVGTRVIDDAAEALGATLAWCVTILNPPLVILGGGLWAAAGDLMLDKAKEAMRVRVLPEVYATLKIAQSQVKSSALGAAALVYQAGFFPA